MEGKFITIEGIDGCGKTTQIELLKKRFKDANKKFWFTSEPTGGPIGKMIREYYLRGNMVMNDKIVLDSLFLADRLDHITSRNGIKYHLEIGDNVICDRYIISGVSYMAANLILKRGYKINHAIYEAISHNKVAADLLTPNLIIILDLQPEEAIKRIENRNKFEIYEKMDYQKIVYDVIHNTVNVMKCLYPKTRFVYIDANDNPYCTNEKIWNHICRIIN